jgi:hypothetical protein
MTNASNFGIGPARSGSPVERSGRGDSAASAGTYRTPADFRPSSGGVSRTAAGSPPTAGDGSRQLWVPAPRAPTAGRPDTGMGIREATLADVVVISLPEQFVPIAKGLALGKPDVTISRLLDMSPRSFSRRVAEFLAYLGVETRFQAGMEVMHRRMSSAEPRIR